MSDVYQALSSPVRREILSLLKDKDLTAGEVAEKLNVSKSTLSGHFNVLKSADLVSSSRLATTITYSLKTSVVEDLVTSVMTMFGVEDKSKKESK